MSDIQWTDETWNPVVGCTVVSPGCKDCYAMKDAYRKGFNPLTPHYRGLTMRVNGHAVWTGKLALAEHKLDDPCHWRKPRKVFVNSMGDLFHEDAPDAWIDAVFSVMAACPQHVFQALTKRAERMRDYCRDREPLPNVWLGVSVEDQRRAEERLPILRQTNAVLRWASVEPLLESVDLRAWLAGLDWIVVGGESGPDARPFDLAWARDVLSQCCDAGVPCFVKQMGSNPVESGEPFKLADRKGGDIEEWPANLRVREFPND
jgi:protein gp37